MALYVMIDGTWLMLLLSVGNLALMVSNDCTSNITLEFRKNMENYGGVVCTVIVKT